MSLYTELNKAMSAYNRGQTLFLVTQLMLNNSDGVMLDCGLSKF